jgi:hypothetical protein
MDDDWNMKYDHIRFAVRVWQGQFFNHIVGHHHQGRTHGQYKGRYKYLKDNEKAVSIMLPSGMVYHRKYLFMYTHAIPDAARRLVDENMNCDDILFNFMVANHTQSGPVVLEHWAHSMDMGGLWKDPAHFTERSECLNTFVEMFGNMPLKYTTSFFSEKKDKKGVVKGALPGLKDYRMQK